MGAIVKHRRDVQPRDMGGGVSRRVMSYTEDMMVVEVAFEAGGVGAEHAHVHVQSTYVAAGKFVFTIEGEEHVVSAGDTIVFESGVRHGTVCLEAGAVIDVFSPMREDFLP